MTEELQRKIEDAQIEGWTLSQEQTERAVLVRRKYGSLSAHVLIFLLTFWTFGLGNLIYMAYKYFVDYEKKVVRA